MADRLLKSCADCAHYQEQRARVTDPWRYYCDHPQSGDSGKEMDTPNATPPPEWCPLLKAEDQ